MAKKPKRKKSERKKSGGKKKSRRKEKSGRDASTSVDGASPGIDPDPQTDEAEKDGPGEIDDDAPAVIDVEEELDDPEARAELIAAAAGLAADEEGGDDAGGGDGGDDDRSSAVDDTAAEQGDDAPQKGLTGADSAVEDEALTTPDEGSEEEDGPLIGRAALAALHEFRREGVATMPEELVIELGETVPQEERDRLLAAALSHVHMQEAIYRVPTESGTSRRWKGLIASFVLVAAVFVAGLPPAFLVPEAPTTLSVEERMRGLRVSLLVQAEQIEAFRVRENRLPDSLSEVRSALPGIRFVKSNDRLYQLVAYMPDGEPVVYDSAFPDAVFADVAGSWVTTRTDS